MQYESLHCVSNHSQPCPSTRTRARRDRQFAVARLTFIKVTPSLTSGVLRLGRVFGTEVGTLNICCNLMCCWFVFLIVLFHLHFCVKKITVMMISLFTWHLTDVAYKFSCGKFDKTLYRYPSREIHEFMSLCSKFIEV